MLNSALISGFILSFGLILAIGAQNAFVLRQGLRNENLFAVCLTCAIIDAFLIAMGVFFFEQIETYIPLIVPFMQIAGSCYLIWFALRSFYSAYKANDGLVPTSEKGEDVSKTILKCLTLSLLNPHVYLDTVFLIGSVSTSFGEQKNSFALGAMTASMVFFFLLGYLSRYLKPILSKPFSWRILDCGIGITMLFIAYGLIASIEL